MSKIKDFWVEEIRRHAATIAKKALVTINGEEYTYPITKTVIRDGFFKHYIEIEDEPIGNIQKAILVNENDIPLYIDDTHIEKGDDGWQIAFKLFVIVKEDDQDAG